MSFCFALLVVLLLLLLLFLFCVVVSVIGVVGVLALSRCCSLPYRYPLRQQCSCWIVQGSADQIDR